MTAARPYVTIALASGGTGGHVFPAEALARALMARGHRPVLFSDRRGDAFAKTDGIERRGIPAGALHGGAGRLLRGAVLSLRGTATALLDLRRIGASAAVGFGGHPMLPTLCAAWLLRLPIVLHEQNAVLGRANRLFAGAATRIAVSFATPRGVADRHRAKLRDVGTPVRPAVLAKAGAPYRASAGAEPFSLLIFGGSQGARIFGQVVPPSLASLPAPLKARLRVVQQCRPEDLDAVAAAYRQANVQAELKPFFDDMGGRLAAAHLVIARSGASTMAELATLGRPAVLVPLPGAADDHQTANALAIVDAGGAWLIPEREFTPAALARRLADLMGDPGALNRAAAAFLRHARPDAADRLADLVIKVVEGGR